MFLHYIIKYPRATITGHGHDDCDTDVPKKTIATENDYS